jgi:hypothetical protein
VKFTDDQAIKQELDLLKGWNGDSLYRVYVKDWVTVLKEIQQLRGKLGKIQEIACTSIPYYAYGDNEAAVCMKQVLTDIDKMCKVSDEIHRQEK